MRETPEDRFRLPEITKQRRTEKLRRKLEEAHPMTKKKTGISKGFVLIVLVIVGLLLYRYGPPTLPFR